MSIPDITWGGTDSGGQARPKISFSGSYAGVHEDIVLPADGFEGLNEEWLPDTLTNTALDGRRTTLSLIHI